MGNQKKLTKQDINKVYFRNLFALQFGWNYEKMQGLGYASWLFQYFPADVSSNRRC